MNELNMVYFKKRKKKLLFIYYIIHTWVVIFDFLKFSDVFLENITSLISLRSKKFKNSLHLWADILKIIIMILKYIITNKYN